MYEAPQASQLKDALIHFESLIASVPAPDDVCDWCARLKLAVDRLEALVQIRRKPIHDKLFGAMAVQDPSRRDRVAEFKQADQEIETLFDIVKTHIIVRGLPKSDLEQSNVERHILDLTDRGKELIYRIKDQGETVAAWFPEPYTT